MGTLTRISTGFPEVFVIEPGVFSDPRGFFLEGYSHRDFEKIGIPDTFVQDNHSCSRKGVIRGLHFQREHPQGKLVRVLRGSIFDVIVDIRKNSPDYGKFISLELTAENHRMVWVPAGFAHGFLALEDATEVLYKTTDYYYPQYDAGIFWNDPDLGISWPLEQHSITSVTLSDKDALLPRLRKLDSPSKYPGSGS
jgi:dTDP-4-dehydrorhamnose 3,5-epimerase